MSECAEHALDAKTHYHHVLKLEENDVETHYQLSLLYLTMMETTLIQSIDHIRSPLAAVSIQTLEADLCSGRRPVPIQRDFDHENTRNEHGHSHHENDGNDNEDTYSRLRVNYADYPIGRGIYSPWYSERIEIHDLCARHLSLTMASWGDGDDVDDAVSMGIGGGRGPELDPVVFGSYITSARLLYLECSAPFCMDSAESASPEVQRRKLALGIDRLQSALELNDRDATLHHDLGLLLSHRLVGRYEEAIGHWQSAEVLDGGNPIYHGQIGYLYQYHVVSSGTVSGSRSGSSALAMRHYERSLQLNPQQAQIWNNLGILWAQSASDGLHIAEATECWRRCLRISPNHCEAHRNLGNIQWLHFRNTHRGEVHLQRAIAIASTALKALDVSWSICGVFQHLHSFST